MQFMTQKWMDVAFDGYRRYKAKQIIKEVKKTFVQSGLRAYRRLKEQQQR